MVYRIFTEKKKELAAEANALLEDIRSLLQITSVTALRIINRYDAENITEELFDYAIYTVFSEPQLDLTYRDLPNDGAVVFAVEYLPGQFDQRADSAAQCIQLISRGDRPLVRTAKVYMLYGNITDAQLSAIKKYVINPVESREASLEKPETLVVKYELPSSVATLDGFTALDDNGLSDFIRRYGLAMDIDDLRFCRDYFRSEHRDPTVTEIRMIDTYWSDHCRHTTFLTHIDHVTFEDELLQSAYQEYLSIRKELGRTKPICLMDIATVAAKYLKAQGCLEKMEESEEINACTVKIKVDVEGEDQDWLLLFKNETHNHPTEIEPFGGAATCIGGAIRDPLSGRASVYVAMRVTGAANPLTKLSETLPLPLRQTDILLTATRSGWRPALWTKSTTKAMPQSAWRSVPSLLPHPPKMFGVKFPLPETPSSSSAALPGATGAEVRPVPQNPTPQNRLRPAAQRFRRAMPPRNGNCSVFSEIPLPAA